MKLSGRDGYVRNSGGKKFTITNEELREAVKKGWIKWDDIVFSEKAVRYARENWNELLRENLNK